MKHFFFFFLFCILTIISCKEYPCSHATGNISITGFSVNETDTVIVRKYAKSTNFTTPLDTFVVDSLNSSYLRKGNVLEIYGSISHGNDYGLLSTFDYEIYLPKPNRLFQISELTEKQESRSTGFLNMDHRGCNNGFNSYKVNGVPNGYSEYLIRVSK